MIELRNITKLFDRKAAVDEVSLQIPRGRIYGLIGPNGAGKTTTLRILATLIKPDEGSVRIGPYELSDRISEARRSIGFMADRQGNYRGLAADEYLGYFGRLHHLRGAALSRRIDTILELTDLGGVRDERVSALSTGMRQRLALAKTLLHDPEVLILDEPASGLDPRARIEIRELLKELGRMGKTVVISSHILADLEDICTDIGIMEQGRLIMSGSLEEIRHAAREGRRLVRVRIAETEVERAVKALEVIEGITSATALTGSSRGEIQVELNGARGNRILSELIALDIEVLAFSEEKASLETIFIDSTRGIVQ